jgi:hypothetical protein
MSQSLTGRLLLFVLFVLCIAVAQTWGPSLSIWELQGCEDTGDSVAPDEFAVVSVASLLPPFLRLTISRCGVHAHHFLNPNLLFRPPV